MQDWQTASAHAQAAKCPGVPINQKVAPIDSRVGLWFSGNDDVRRNEVVRAESSRKRRVSLRRCLERREVGVLLICGDPHAARVCETVYLPGAWTNVSKTFERGPYKIRARTLEVSPCPLPRPSILGLVSAQALDQVGPDKPTQLVTGVGDCRIPRLIDPKRLVHQSFVELLPQSGQG